MKQALQTKKKKGVRGPRAAFVVTFSAASVAAIAAACGGKVDGVGADTSQPAITTNPPPTECGDDCSQPGPTTNPPATGCPAALPSYGAACSGVSGTCQYNAACAGEAGVAYGSYLAACTGGAWTFEGTGCAIDAGPYLVDDGGFEGGPVDDAGF